MSTSINMQEGRPKRKAAAAALKAITSHGKRRSKNPSVQPRFDPFRMSLPDEITLLILGFLPKPDLVHGSSLVSKSWCVACRDPALWPALGSSMYSEDNLTTVDRFFDLLRRPQFSQLKSLEPPKSLVVSHTRKIAVYERLGENCPHLNTLRLQHWDLIPNSNNLLLQIPKHFPNLQRLDVYISLEISTNALKQFLQKIGGRLHELLIQGFSVLTSESFSAIGEACPNLKVFGYKGLQGWSSSRYFASQDVIGLIESCTKLEELRLCLPSTCPSCLGVLKGVDQFKRENIQQNQTVTSLKLHDRIAGEWSYEEHMNRQGNGRD